MKGFRRLDLIVLLILVGCSASESSVQQGTSVQQDKVASQSVGEHSQSSSLQPHVTQDLGVGNSVTHKSKDAGKTNQCRTCHEDYWNSYQQTHHSRSLAEVDGGDHQRLGGFNHPTTAQTYRVLAKGDQLVHLQRTPVDSLGVVGGDQAIVHELPVSYVMGSGAFARGYLLRDDPFLLQSPVTWYRASNEFAIAPGYDHLAHDGLTRVIEADCLACHAGGFSLVNRNPMKVSLDELSIGCERCHGPADDHLKWAEKKASGASTDSEALIVNPKELSREQLESICANCHLDGDITVFAAGTDRMGFRPGQRLSDNRSVFQSIGGTKKKRRFSNHFERMWQSRCYTESDTMTCVTCHDPHQTHASQQSVQVYRQMCLKCHDDNACDLDSNARLDANGNSCFACHMPRSATEISHASTTDHFIAKPSDHVSATSDSDNASADESGVISLYPPAWRLSADRSQRRRLMAEAQLAIENAFSGNMDRLSAFPVAELEETAGNDPSAIAMVADVMRHRGDDGAKVVAYASKVIQLSPQPTKSHQLALEILSAVFMDTGQYDSARDVLQRLTQHRRVAADWYNLALCQARLRRFTEAEASLKQSLELDPTYARSYRSLAKLYSAVNPAIADQLSRIADALSRSF